MTIKEMQKNIEREIEILEGDIRAGMGGYGVMVKLKWVLELIDLIGDEEYES